MYYSFQDIFLPLQKNTELICVTYAQYNIMVEDRKKNNHGGVREGAGRKRSAEPGRLFSFRASGKMSLFLESRENRTEFIKSCIERGMETAEPDFSQLGESYPATMVKGLEIPFFNAKIVAGFPIPLDNDERSESIELLQMLCPYPESSYLIRVKGDSMIDADIRSGDIVIVDKSNRNPTPSEVAVCEFNGEYTLKHFEIRDGVGWLVPANPAFPEIPVTEYDTFRIWGTVTYVIHKPQ